MYSSLRSIIPMTYVMQWQSSCVWLTQAADMAVITSSSPVTHQLTNHVMFHKTSPSSTDTACSQDDDDQPLELTSHSRLTTTSSCTTTALSPLNITSPAAQPQLPALAANTLRWTGRPPSSVLFSAFCDANSLMQTGMSRLLYKLTLDWKNHRSSDFLRQTQYWSAKRL